MASKSQETTKNNNLEPPTEKAPLLFQKEQVALMGGDFVAEEQSSDGDGEFRVESLQHRTNALETFIHLLKGYIGAGMLSLPWAVSQLGVVGGVLGIWTLSWWSSHNCYTVVSIKRYMERTTTTTTSTEDYLNPTNTTADDQNSETSSNITYPHLGEWAYGVEFQKYTTACIIVQQLAVCTVYVSFVGENVQAVLHSLHLPASHVQVMSMALPAILLLSWIPSLKLLAPVMAVGTALLLVSLTALGVIVEEEWDSRPPEPPAVVLSKVPVALSMILYSYEGICIILPVQSAMKQPSKFGAVFVFTMVVVAMLYAIVGVTCVYAFGNVTSGSLTAFLLDRNDNERIAMLVNIANAAVSFSVLLTFPLTIFPAVELLGIIAVENSNSVFAKCMRGGRAVEKHGDEDSLEAFEPLPPLPEDDIASIDSLPTEHYYEQQDDFQSHAHSDVASASSGVTFSSTRWAFNVPGDSLQLRSFLVLLTYIIAVVVPNVQALISLAGAVAGSSTALLIPPLLELAWIEHLEHSEQAQEKNPTTPVPTASPHVIRMQNRNNKQKRGRRKGRWTSGNYWKDKTKCYVLIVLGAIFMAIGTFASISDIVNLYMHGENVNGGN